MVFTVGFDASAMNTAFKAHAGRGIGRYVGELSRYFASITDRKLRILPFDQQALLCGGCAERVINRLPFGRSTARQQLFLPWCLRGKKAQPFNLLHFPAHMDAPAWGFTKYVITVLDLIPLVLSDLYRADRPNWRFHLARRLELLAIKNAAAVIAISANTARDVERVLGIPPEKIAVTPLGVDQRFFIDRGAAGASAVKAKFGLPLERKLILYVGGIDQRKNCLGLLETFRRVIEQRREQRSSIPLLLFAGGRIESDAEYPKLSARIKDLELEENIVFLGHVPDSDLPSLYAASDVFCFPSLYEGFGLTPLEALAAGTPVVSSNAACMPEVLSDAAVLFDPRNSGAAAEAICRILADPAWAEELKRRGPVQAAKFSWDRTGEETLRVYERFAKDAC